ncbi:MAG: hypothetical protein KJ721_03255 [Nanoarchaeota archaeon]|nr:hypothetical protein [Nanoarchaeota archaeon]
MSEIKIPYSYKIVDIGKTDKTKRIAVESHEGKLAVVKDDHQEGYCPTGILEIGDRDVYWLKTVGEGSDRRLHYHDLITLLVSFP